MYHDGGTVNTILYRASQRFQIPLKYANNVGEIWPPYDSFFL